MLPSAFSSSAEMTPAPSDPDQRSPWKATPPTATVWP